MPESTCDTYVYDRWLGNGGSRRQHLWYWNCPCGAFGGPFKRRMDADEAAGKHQDSAK